MGNESKGIGSQIRKAEVLTPEEELHVLWTKGLLGDHSHYELLNTVFFMNSLNFALGNGSEHRNLRLNPPQSRGGQTKALPSLISKNIQGGLKHHKQAKKNVQHSNQAMGAAAQEYEYAGDRLVTLC